MSGPKPSLDNLRIERKEQAESRNRLRGPVILMLGLAVLALLAWKFTSSHALEVRTALAKEEASAAAGGSERTVLNASGYMTARREATVSSKVTGKVVEVHIEEGMQVQEGQILARLDDTNVKASLLLPRPSITPPKLPWRRPASACGRPSRSCSARRGC